MKHEKKMWMEEKQLIELVILLVFDHRMCMEEKQLDYNGKIAQMYTLTLS